MIFVYLFLVFIWVSLNEIYTLSLYYGCLEPLEGVSSNWEHFFAHLMQLAIVCLKTQIPCLKTRRIKIWLLELKALRNKWLISRLFALSWDNSSYVLRQGSLKTNLCFNVWLSGYKRPFVWRQGSLVAYLSFDIGRSRDKVTFFSIQGSFKAILASMLVYLETDKLVSRDKTRNL